MFSCTSIEDYVVFKLFAGKGGQEKIIILSGRLGEDLINNELTGLARLLLFRDVISRRPLEFSSSKDAFERFTFTDLIAAT